MKAHFEVTAAPGARTGRRLYDARQSPAGRFQLRREAV
jgi:hypothetical protein